MYSQLLKGAWLWYAARVVSLTTMPISCATLYKAAVESVRILSAPAPCLARPLTLVIPIASPALVVPLVALIRSVHEGTVSASPCTKVWVLGLARGEVRVTHNSPGHMIGKKL